MSHDLDNIITDTVAEVPEPSPIADMQDNIEKPVEEVKETVKKRGRPKKVKNESFKEDIKGLDTQLPPVDNSTAGIEPCAEIAVAMVNMSGMFLGGEQAVMHKNEMILAKNGFVAYFTAKGIDNVPAWVVLAGALTPYYLRVLTTTPAKTNVSNFGGRLILRVKEMFKGKKYARSNSRDYNVGENNPS